MAATGTPPSPFIHQSFISLSQRRNPSSRPQTPLSHQGGSMNSSTPSSSPGGLLEPAPGISYADFVKQWQDAHIARWLADNRCAHHAASFRENDIRGDIILELDADNLRELGVTTVGDRTRIRSAIKELRRLCAMSGSQGQSGPKLVLNGGSTDLRFSKTTGLKLRNEATGIVQETNTSNATAAARNSRGRPAPLQLDNVVERDLPQIQRLDSARSTTTPTPRGQASNNRAPSGPPPKGPLPSTPSNLRSVPRLTVPGSATQRSRTPTESSNPPPFTNDPLPPAPSPSSPWATAAGLPRNPAPGNLPGGSFAPRTTSPLPQAGRNRLQGAAAPFPPTHQRQSSGTRGGSTHPYSSANASLAPGPISAHALSPVSESFIAIAGSPPSGYSVGRGPFDRRQPQRDEDVKRKLLKFWMGDMNSRVLEIRELEDGTELLERALRKFGVSVEDYPPPVDGTLSVGGYALYLGSDSDPLSETKLLALIHDPENIGRENLHIRPYVSSAKRSKLERVLGEAPPQQAPVDDTLATTRNQKKMNRASTISVLSGLGVPLGSPPTSPGGTKSTSATSASFGKLRNFFGHRPPSELITTHLPEYFPFADKKVLKKTARHSMMQRQSMKPGGNPGSAGAWVPPRNTSRFSTSTIASRRSTRNSGVPSGSVTLVDTASPRQSQEEKRQGIMAIPRVSIEGDDGAIHLTLVDEEPSPSNDAEFSKQQDMATKALPVLPVAFAPDTFSTDPNQLAVTDTSRAARRASKITELKPSNPVPEFAMVTVENVTTGIEQSIAQERVRDSLLPGALDMKRLSTASVSVAVQKRESLQPKEVPVDEAGTDEEEEEEEEETEEEETEEEDEEEEIEDDTPAKVTSEATTRSIKWIRGALIGSGSFGNVYLGMDAQRGLLMAVKQVELKGSQYSEERKRSMLSALEREIELLKTLQHENIVQYLDSAIDDNNLNIFLEYVPGGSVSSLLRNYGAFEESLTANWVRQILRGLEYLHGQTIIHRDIKGANILVDNKGGIKISDFGISKKVEEGLPRANRMSLQGSVFWMAPEVVKQTSYTSKADIWSVGCLIIEMLTGQHPFPDSTQMQTLFKLGSGTVKPAIPSDVTAHGTDFLQKTFELDHTLRPSATELLNHPWLAETV